MDYNRYVCSKKEIFKLIVLYLCLDLLITFFFYKSVAAFLILLLGFPIAYKSYKKDLCEKRKRKLVAEFSETLTSVSVNMKAGFSLENAFVESYKDIKLFYKEESLMAEEILRIRKGLEINITLEELIEDLSKRSGQEEITLFSEVLKASKRNGGNITEVLSNTAERIQESICVDKEIETLISEKKLELRIMEIMPFVILLYLQVTSVGYFDVCYEGVKGRVFMSGMLLIYFLSMGLGKKIMKIEV